MMTRHIENAFPERLENKTVDGMTNDPRVEKKAKAKRMTYKNRRTDFPSVSMQNYFYRDRCFFS